jgi:hypothetical protein
METSKRYVLLYGGLEIGEVVEQDSDFPNCFGTWMPSANTDYPELRRRIRAYIEYSEHADSLMVGGDEWEAYTGEREPEFNDLIESAEWALRDENGVRHWLLVPNFCRGGELVWRYNPGRAV